MTVDEVKSFLAVVRTANLSIAANSLYITQPALTHRINSLEQKLGYELLERHPGIRKVKVTERGNAFIPIAEQWVQLWSQAVSLRNQAPLERLRVASIESVNLYVLDPILQEIMTTNSRILLTLKTQYSPQCYQDIMNGLVDFAIVASLQNSNSIANAPAFEEEMIFLCHKGITSCGDIINPTDFNSQNHIHIPWCAEYETWYQYWFPLSDASRMYLQSIANLPQYLMQEDSWTIVPATAARHIIAKNENLEAHLMKNGPENRINHFIWPKGTVPPYFSELKKLLKTELDKTDGITVLY